jgi:hypothetical protein
MAGACRAARCCLCLAESLASAESSGTQTRGECLRKPAYTHPFTYSCALVTASCRRKRNLDQVWIDSVQALFCNMLEYCTRKGVLFLLHACHALITEVLLCAHITLPFEY